MKINRLAVSAASILTVLALFPPIPVRADRAYEPVSGSAMTFEKYLLMDKEAFAPNATFRFEIIPGKARDATDETTAVIPGPGKPMIGEAVFSPDDPVLTQPGSSDFVTLSRDQGFVKKYVTVDFSDCHYTEPGVYRYLIREQDASSQGMVHDINTVRTADIYVTDEGEELKVAACVLHAPTSGAEAPAPKRGSDGGTADVKADGERLGDKSVGFTNRYDTEDLIFSKTVKGNQGARDQYFRFTLTITGAIPGTRYHVDLTRADSRSGKTDATKDAYRNQDNPALLVADDKGALTQAFYLQDGQQIRIAGIASGTKYDLSEDAEDYVPSIQKKTEDPDPVVRKDGASDQTSGITADTTFVFINTKGGLIPTGLFLGVGSTIALALLAASAFLLHLVPRRRMDGKR